MHFKLVESSSFMIIFSSLVFLFALFLPGKMALRIRSLPLVMCRALSKSSTSRSAHPMASVGVRSQHCLLAGKCGQIGGVVSPRLFSTEDSVPVVDFDNFEKIRNEGSSYLLDVRNPKELQDEGAIPGAVNIPLDQIPVAFQMSGVDFEDTFDHEKPGQDQRIVTFCKKGIRSASAGKMLVRDFGYKNVFNYLGSNDEWQEKHRQ